MHMVGWGHAMHRERAIASAQLSAQRAEHDASTQRTQAATTQCPHTPRPPAPATNFDRHPAQAHAGSQHRRRQAPTRQVSWVRHRSERSRSALPVSPRSLLQSISSCCSRVSAESAGGTQQGCSSSRVRLPARRSRGAMSSARQKGHKWRPSRASCGSWAACGTRKWGLTKLLDCHPELLSRVGAGVSCGCAADTPRMQDHATCDATGPRPSTCLLHRNGVATIDLQMGEGGRQADARAEADA